MPYKDIEKQRQYQREYVARRRTQWFEGKSCVDCGSTFNLELDHVDPATKISNSIWSWSDARIKEETDKCVVRCHECHLERTKTQLVRPLAHGTNSAYVRGCRCELCKRVHYDTNNEWRYEKGLRKRSG